MEASNFVSPLKYTILFVSMVLVQVLICNNILLFGVAVPFIFIYFIIVLPLNTSLNLLLIISFLLGFTIDIFSDTMGLYSLSSLVLAALKKPVFYLYVPKDDKFNIYPSISEMGWENYLKFILTLSALFCLMVFGIELFGFASFGRIIALSSESALFTIVLIITVDALFNKG